MNVTLVPLHLVDGVWGRVSRGFQRASDRFGGDLTPGELWQMCRTGQAHLFVVHDDQQIVAATAWRFEIWGKGPRYRCLALYGKGVMEWKDQLRTSVENAARDCGAAGLIADGRLGWKAIYPDAKVLRVVYETPLTTMPSTEPV